MAKTANINLRVEPEVKTEQAIAETKAMMEGTRKSKQYSSPRELFAELDAEGDD